MDAHESDPLSDSSLEHEIEAALDVEPSPQFLACVRTRIASGRAASPWPLRFGRGWPGAAGWECFAAGAAVAIMAIAIIVFMRSARESPAQPEVVAPGLVAGQTVEGAPLGGEGTPGPGAARDPGTPVEAPRAARRIEPRPQVTPPAESEPPMIPEVLVSPEERLAFDLVVTMARQGRASGLPPLDRDAQADVLEPRDLHVGPSIRITPLDIEPLPQIARLEIGDGQ